MTAEDAVVGREPVQSLTGLRIAGVLDESERSVDRCRSQVTIGRHATPGVTHSVPDAIGAGVDGATFRGVRRDDRGIG